MSTVTELEAVEREIADLHAQDEKYGLGSRGKARLASFEKDADALRYTQRQAELAAARELDAAAEEYAQAWADWLQILDGAVNARRTLTVAKRRLQAAERAATVAGCQLKHDDSAAVWAQSAECRDLVNRVKDELGPVKVTA